jgi:hypothetical protein
MVTDSGDLCFTCGRVNLVDTMHPIADPPFVRVMNDQGHKHGLEVSDLRQFVGL